MSDTVGSLDIEVKIRLDKMQADFDRLTNSVKSHNAAIKSEFKGMVDAVKGFFTGLVPTVTALGIADFTKTLVTNAEQIVNSADAARMGAENFQVFARLAKEGGVSVEQLTRGLDAMEKKIADAADGVKAAKVPFEDLGLNINQLKTLAPEQQFELIARSVVGAKDQTKAFADAMDIIGLRAGPRLLEVLKRVGTEGFDANKKHPSEGGC